MMPRATVGCDAELSIAVAVAVAVAAAVVDGWYLGARSVEEQWTRWGVGGGGPLLEEGISYVKWSGGLAGVSARG